MKELKEYNENEKKYIEIYNVFLYYKQMIIQFTETKIL